MDDPLGLTRAKKFSVILLSEEIKLRVVRDFDPTQMNFREKISLKYHLTGSRPILAKIRKEIELNKRKKEIERLAEFGNVTRNKLATEQEDLLKTSGFDESSFSGAPDGGEWEQEDDRATSWDSDDLDENYDSDYVDENYDSESEDWDQNYNSAYPCSEALTIKRGDEVETIPSANIG